MPLPQSSPPQQWTPFTLYILNEIVDYNGALYTANADHVSAATFNGALWNAVGTGGTSGPAGGKLTGTYPNPGLAASVVDAASAGVGLVPVGNGTGGYAWGAAAGIIVVQGGNLGSSYTLPLTAGKDTWLIGTLNANLALTVSGLASGTEMHLLLTQDGTGGRTLTINGTTMPIPASAAVSMIIEGYDDGTNLYLGLVGGSSSLTAYATITEAVNTVAASGAAQTIPDVTTATINQITLTANCTFTFPAAAAGKSFLLALKQDGTGSRTVTWPGTVLWPGGTAPTLTTGANKTDAFSMVCADGAHWLGITVGENF